jgi:Domain of unknown function (DUF4352)
MRKTIIAALAALAIGLTGCSVTGGAPTHTATYVAQTPVTTVAPTAPTDPRIVRIGSPVRNGSLVFTVQSTRRAAQVYDQFGGYYYPHATNEYVIVKLTVQNVDTHSVFFFYGSQTLDLHGQQVSTDSAATGALNPAVTPIIQPGLAIPVELAFIVAEGAQPEAIMLSDQLYMISHPLSAAVTRVELVTP